MLLCYRLSAVVERPLNPSHSCSLSTMSHHQHSRELIKHQSTHALLSFPLWSAVSRGNNLYWSRQLGDPFSPFWLKNCLLCLLFKYPKITTPCPTLLKMVLCLQKVMLRVAHILYACTSSQHIDITCTHIHSKEAEKLKSLPPSSPEVKSFSKIVNNASAFGETRQCTNFVSLT